MLRLLEDREVLGLNLWLNLEAGGAEVVVVVCGLNLWSLNLVLVLVGC